jgi:signal transduction histidine kinase
MTEADPRERGVPGTPHLSGPQPAAGGAQVTERDFTSVVAQMGHSLRSILELGQELALSRGLYEIIDSVLLNLMGQLGTSKAVLWVLPAEKHQPPVPMRRHGVPRRWAPAIGAALASPNSLCAFEGTRPVEASVLGASLKLADRKLIEEAGLGLFAPIQVHGKLAGFVALGSRISGEPFRSVDLQAVQSSLGMLGVAMENTSLYNNLLERNRQLRQAAEDLKELDRLKSEFLNNVNHELRTPLTIVIAYLEMLLGGKIQGSEREEFLRITFDESRKLMAMFDRLLDFSNLTRDGLDIQLQAGDVRVLLEEYYRDRLPGIVEGLREFTLRSECGSPPVQFDARRVRQILDAVVDNAIKFTPQGSHIVLRAVTVEERGKNWLRIDVEDDGPGIDIDQIPLLFDSFRQLDGSTTRTVGGMGIGLAMAKSLAQRMGGDLRIQSEVGMGSVFSLLLPISDD